MPQNLLDKLKRINPWHYIWLCPLLSELFTLISNSILSLAWWGHISTDLLLIGSIDALAVSLLVAVIMFYAIINISRLGQANKALETALEENRVIQEGLGRSEEKYRALFEKSGDATFILAADGPDSGRILEANHAAAVMHGFTREEILRLKISDLDCHQDRQLVPERMGKILAGQWLDFEVDHFRKDGSIFPVEVTAGLFEAGGAKYVLAFDRDISDRRGIARALEEEKDRYRTLFEANTDGILVADSLTRKFLFANPAIGKMLGYEPDELVGKEVEDIHPREDLPQALAAFRAQLSGKIDLAVEVPCLTKDGRTIHADIHATPISFAGRSCLMGFFRDVGNRMQARRDLSRLEAQLSHAQKMEAVGVLASGIAHDFNNILQTISGHTQLLLLNEGRSVEDRQRLERISQAGERAADLIRRLLAFSRKVESRREALDLNRQIQQMVAMLEHTLPRMIVLEVDLASDLPPVSGDPGQLDQVLLNLASNARDAMPAGGRLLLRTEMVKVMPGDARHPPDLPGGSYVKLTVSDTGQGIPAAIRDRIFEPFFTTKPTGKGTGLGLATVYGIVTGHGGKIVCDSLGTEGTTFTIYLPAGEGGQLGAGFRDRSESQAPGGNETVLVVDDEDEIRRTTCEALTAAGYATVPAATGEEAVEYFLSHRSAPDLVLLDMSMPGMGGESCLRRLLELDPRAKVLVCSGYLESGIKNKVLKMGAMGMLSKPFGFGELLLRVRRALDESRWVAVDSLPREGRA